MGAFSKGILALLKLIAIIAVGDCGCMAGNRFYEAIVVNDTDSGNRSISGL